ncbi:hypothetical protein ACOMHN_035457 [Nucella lapillus]
MREERKGRRPGHKHGDPACTLTPPDLSSQPTTQSGEEKVEEATESQNSPRKSSPKRPTKVTDKDPKSPQGSSGNRSRQSARHTTFSRAFGDAESRRRSTTSKRRLPVDPDSPPATTSKLPRQTEESDSNLAPEDSGEADHQDSPTWE